MSYEEKIKEWRENILFYIEFRKFKQLRFAVKIYRNHVFLNCFLSSTDTDDIFMTLGSNN